MAISTEMPNVPRRATSSSISSRPSGSRPAVGSSSSTSSGSPTSAWASLVRWRIPVEKPPIGRKRASSRPTRSRMSEARWRAARGGSPLSSPKVATTSDADLIERQAVVLGHVAEPRPHGDGIGGDVDAAHLDAALRRVGEPEQQPEHRGLAGAVGADQADEATRERHRQPVEGDDSWVALGQALDAQEGTGFHDPWSLPGLAPHAASSPSGGLTPEVRRRRPKAPERAHSFDVGVVRRVSRSGRVVTSASSCTARVIAT